MSIISIPWTFSAGAVIIASQHNSNFSTIVTDYNGFIDNNNIAAAAGIVYSKLTLTGSLVNADISASAAIVASKLVLTSPGAIGSVAPNTGAFTTFKVGTTNQGDVLYDNGTSIIRLTPGTSGQFLQTQGAAANPQWASTSSAYTAGDYSLIEDNTFYVESSVALTKHSEFYLSRSGALRIKFYIGGGSGSGVKGQIYKNGVAVGTARQGTGLYSEDISGWVAGDLCQLYIADGNGGTSAYGGAFQLFEGTPAFQSINRNTYPVQRTYSGPTIPASATLNGLGQIGDYFSSVAGGATTTLYVKTGAATWTAK